ncbi:MAG: Mini-ribonuclease 3 [Solobacterium sp.]|nr:Mini-ribonuclease 3 [Solobacterium sp.]
MRPDEHSGRTLAYLGDAVWTLKVREWLIEQGYGTGKQLQKLTIRFVSARGQAALYDHLHEEGWFTETEEELFHRGRNDNAGTVPRSTDVLTYRRSTGFEAILGWLRLSGQDERIDELLQKAVEMTGVL